MGGRRDVSRTAKSEVRLRCGRYAERCLCVVVGGRDGRRRCAVRCRPPLPSGAAAPPDEQCGRGSAAAVHVRPFAAELRHETEMWYAAFRLTSVPCMVLTVHSEGPSLCAGNRTAGCFICGLRCAERLSYALPEAVGLASVLRLHFRRRFVHAGVVLHVGPSLTGFPSLPFLQVEEHHNLCLSLEGAPVQQRPLAPAVCCN